MFFSEGSTGSSVSSSRGRGGRVRAAVGARGVDDGCVGECRLAVRRFPIHKLNELLV